MHGLTGRPYSTVNYGTKQGIEGVVVNIHGSGPPAQEGNVRVRRDGGRIIIEDWAGNGWHFLCAYRDVSEEDE